MIDTLIFDFWRTLAKIPEHNPYMEVRRILGFEQMPEAMFVRVIDGVLSSQYFPNPRDGTIELCKCLRINIDDNKIDSILEVLGNKKPVFFEETLEVLTDLRESGYKLGLLSVMQQFDEAILRRDGFHNYFDVFMTSCAYGALKPNIPLLKHVINKLGSDEKNTVMVGDNIVDDVMPLNRIGATGILLDRDNISPYSLRITNLKELKPLLSQL